MFRAFLARPAHRGVAAAASLLFPAALLPVLLVSQATAAVVPASSLGNSPSTAAGSCWEIKQKRSTAASGVYWLQTPAMAEAQEFYCDQATDGGGWVLIGKGREGWTTEYNGKGEASALQTPVTSPMSSVTVQLPASTVDGLLNMGRVDALPDGIRLRRAQDTLGIGWQESRTSLTAKAGWSWNFGSGQGVGDWKVGTASGRGGTTASYGSSQGFNRVVSSTDESKKWRVGFGYGTSVLGYTDPKGHLWAAANGRGGAIPYTQMYVRPRISSTTGYAAIPDSGTPAIPRPMSLSSNALLNPWGVGGIKGSVAAEGTVEVQAFTQSGSTMFVGGNFRYVQKADGTGRVDQSFLAAFDVETGEWIPTFAPVLNEQVKALATLPDGSVVAGGDFSTVNGAPATAIVALDPRTGATRSGWSLTLENRTTAGVLKVRALDLRGSDLVIGGSFTHLSGGSAPSRVVYSRNAARVDAASATPAVGWNPDFNGTVVDLDLSDDGERVYAAGHFTTSKGAAAPKVASLSATGTAERSGPVFAPIWSNTKNNYQQAVQQVGSRVFVGGSEHALFQFSTSSFAKLAGNITLKGGDFQALETDGDLVYGSCHCSQWNYSGASTWADGKTDSGWTKVDAIKWVGVWNARTGEVVPDFVPNLGMRLGSGPWALKKDTAGNLWVGGDINEVRTGRGSNYAGGFARFPRTDATAPPAPASLRLERQDAATATLSWDRVVDPAGGTVYQILREDRVIASVTGVTSLAVPHSGTERYFVRAVDRAGNIGPSTAVLTVGPPAANQPPVPSFTAQVVDRTVTVDASESTDDRGIARYDWNFGNGTTATGVTASTTYTSAGTYTITLTVTDSEGVARTTQRTVSPTATTTSAIVPAESAWQWYYRDAAPAASWNTAEFDAADWSSGRGVLGFGAAVVTTDIDVAGDPSTRPITAYFRRTFDVADPTKVVSLTIDALADDGLVVHVNGVEVGRENMRPGAVLHTTYAPTARRHAVAAAARLVVEVPTSLLRQGTNVIAAESHVNYRRTPDLTFDLKADMVSN